MGVGARHPALISFLSPHSRSDQWATLPLPSSIRVVEHGARRGRVCVCVHAVHGGAPRAVMRLCWAVS